MMIRHPNGLCMVWMGPDSSDMHWNGLKWHILLVEYSQDIEVFKDVSSIFSRNVFFIIYLFFWYVLMYVWFWFLCVHLDLHVLSQLRKCVSLDIVCVCGCVYELFLFMSTLMMQIFRRSIQ